ncbi:hypothetical protein FDK21_10730 [Cohaesibacter sp. CAU 1516]|uniref:hypothetical protein n=1 Tax=Cohaesibacter sp. CAU 1516 TaxID=2576038 RepID=UPI000DEA1102|nr:hypothetical protein [Cohaesibacter sp. CAU 1516]TLP46086.1 hypothetical protein FDK21_10730 [Cohaesibacter sp. CAU 1516]
MLIRSGFILVASLAVVSTISWSDAYACKDKNDCSAGEICCMSPMGGRDHLSTGGKVVQGYCAKAKVCARDDGTSVVYGDGAECPPGQSVKVKTTASGAKIKGCF